MTSHNHTRSDRRPDGRGAGLRTALAIGAAVAVTWVTACPAGAAPSQYGTPQSNWESAVAYSVAAPEALPPGMNDLGCRPGLAHPRPLILINGALLNAYANWAMYSPRLHADTDQVDLVGYSEGGVVPLYYLNVLGGAPRVHTMVSLDSPVRGLSGYGVLAECPLSRAGRRHSARYFRQPGTVRPVRRSSVRCSATGRPDPASDT